MTKKNRKFALIGYPRGHSMSPPIHKRLFEMSSDNSSEYSLIQIEESQFDSRVPELFELDGFNITIPHKVNIIKYTDVLSDSAKRYNSVNVIQKQNGKYIGHNTDVDGFLRTVKNMGVELSGNVCVIGAGGVGRMFAIESAANGADITLAVRKSSLDKAHELCEYIKSEFKVNAETVLCDELSSLNKRFSLMINASPSGMYPKVDAMPIDIEALKKADALFDCIYNPTKTQLIKAAEKLGIKVSGGMDMLVWQAVSAHEIWDNASYSADDINALISEMTAQVDRDFPLTEEKEHRI